ncbi:hydroxyacid dehydrogenase [Ruminococcus sp. CLA-AA-H200]|uniref:Hydroxyacid dehydrogenase n=1 Tax=Ruminococcus turbiniformis TaxID=2881258 RepID=A0ABS8FVN3_9FIRM|nr:four-carbon acid sugar kinase family protein [Ruminococcus turbiniformis]MCC2253614.1 hydroxyacid dehydrogenase [Ruminococcus turbiniformis]
MNTLTVDILNHFPHIDESQIDSELHEAIRNDPHKIVVLDDDPTGVQTVHDISVYTNWSVESIRQGFLEKSKVFYILTNSRSMTREETIKIHREIAAGLSQVSVETGIPYLIISRSDSTLRGHYPIETMVLREETEKNFITVDGEILCPFFKEGGRFTIGNVHYVKNQNFLIPAAKTEFAQDKTFGYSHSSIPEYIEEKTNGRFKADSVTCISLESLRAVDLPRIEAQLMNVRHFNKVCVNAIDYCDLKVFTIALYRAIAKGKKFLFRTAAGLVKVMGGISDIPLLSKQDLLGNSAHGSGIVIVGSHTGKTTEQLNRLLQLDYTVPIEFNSDKVLEGDIEFYTEVNRCIDMEEKILLSGKTAVCYTCRKLLSLESDTSESALLRSVKISDGVQNLIARLKVRPAYIIAKGGITSSDIGTKALAVKKARVMGQIQPGIPVWQTGPESRFPYLPYIIFPGNTGEEDTLKDIVKELYN